MIDAELQSDRPPHSPVPEESCPFCGTATGVQREIEAELASLSLPEFETIARNEWRRRVARTEGNHAYRRRHSRALIRALVVYGLRPESPVRGGAVEELIWQEVARFEAWGLSRRKIQTEFLRLSQAIWEVLSRTELSFERISTLMERIDWKLSEILDWPV